MPDDITPLATTPSTTRLVPLLLAALATLLALALIVHGPIAQWADYHAFADGRAWLGIANAANVLSNLPFALVGAWGLARLAGVDAPGTIAWRAFCAALIGTALGSTAYHLAPENATLALDRLPIALACASLSCALVAERCTQRAGTPTTVALAWLAGASSVAVWWWGERHGTGDLRAYLYVQFLPMLLVPAALLADRRDAPHGVRASAWWSVLALYALAKAMEIADAAVLHALGVVSGHTLKHLLAAAGAACLVAALPVAPRAAQLR